MLNLREKQTPKIQLIFFDKQTNTKSERWKIYILSYSYLCNQFNRKETHQSWYNYRE